ncbi:MAG: Ribosomal RNA small subunit methyltransferase E [Eubacteriales bacterium SKADARSKE-1]|nr:Ribosomal RNA small subunit methyltransferase E [Eubacteriales bacterium SKADARSKE-1]
MIRFFVDEIKNDVTVLDEENANHAIKSLRVKLGEKLILCDKYATEHVCIVNKIEQSHVYLTILEKKVCDSELPTKITLYQALPKGDKMDSIVQKAVELGVYKIVPVLTNRCISRPDQKSIIKKIDRWQKIALEAAKQSGRGIIPKVMPLLELNDIEKDLDKYDCNLIFYEGGGKRIEELLPHAPIQKMSIFIGPEGGFEEYEVNFLEEHGSKTATLGKRILRAETAPIAALSIITYLLEERTNLNVVPRKY